MYCGEIESIGELGIGGFGDLRDVGLEILQAAKRKSLRPGQRAPITESPVKQIHN
jgi:hypothetical protein